MYICVCVCACESFPKVFQITTFDDISYFKPVFVFLVFYLFILFTRKPNFLLLHEEKKLFEKKDFHQTILNRIVKSDT